MSHNIDRSKWLAPLSLPTSPEQIESIQSERKRVALRQARKSAFHSGRLDHIDEDKLDDPEHWRQIPILTKQDLRGLTDTEFYQSFCLRPDDGIAEYWRSGGATGTPLFYPRTFEDMRFAMLSFTRIFDCIGLADGEQLHDSFPLGVHPVGQLFARAAQTSGIGTIWAGAGTTTPSKIQLELMHRLQPTAWMGMSSYGLHLANLAEANGIDLANGSVKNIICSAEPLSNAKRDKLSRSWGASVRDTFGMTEAGMMGAEDASISGFRVWTDMYFLEVVDPESHEPVADGEVGSLVVTPLWTNNCTPFIRWLTGDLVTFNPGRGDSGPFSVFPLVRHAHRTTGFFKIRGVNINHSEFEDFMFADQAINDFKCELVATDGNDQLKVCIEIQRGLTNADISQSLTQRIKSTFEVTPDIVVLKTGTLAQEFESSVKAPRFVDSR